MIDTIERCGEVIGVEQGMAQIRLERDPVCSGCGSRGSCASGSTAAQVIHMALPGHTRLGDQVTVSMPSSSVTQAAALGYLLPSVSLLVGAIVAANRFEGDAAAVLGAGLGFVAGLLLARLISRLAFAKRFVPTTCAGTPPDLQPGDHP